MQSLYPVEKAIRPGCPPGIGGQGQELRYVSGLYVPAHGVLADAIFPRYAAIRPLPGRQQLLHRVTVLVATDRAGSRHLRTSYLGAVKELNLDSLRRPRGRPYLGDRSVTHFQGA